MSDISVSDVDPDDLEQMIKGIDQFDDDLFGKKKPQEQKPKQSPQGSPPKSSLSQSSPESKSVGKKVKFEESDENKEEDLKEGNNVDKPKPAGRKFDFDDNDDILGGLDNTEKAKTKSTASVMDDIFGSKDKKDSFMDDIFGGKTTSKKQNSESKDFILDSKYKKTDSSDSLFGVNDSSSTGRRRRGNPTMETPAVTKPPDKNQESSPKTVNVPKPEPQDNPFPWMSSNRDQTATLPDKSLESTINLESSASLRLDPVVPAYQQPLPVSKTQSKPELQQSSFVSKDCGHDDIMTREMEMQMKMLNDRKLENANALEKQRQQFSEHLEKLYLKQNQMNQMQVEQSQMLLYNFQKQMEDEMLMKQKMMSNQLQMMTKLQTEFPVAVDGSIINFMTQGMQTKYPDIQSELEVVMKEKIKDVESIFKTKEEKLIENYEYVIKDLENKLDIEQGKFRDAAESYREEREKMKENHRRDLERINEEGRQMMETMKSEYLTVINNMKALKKIEMEAKEEFNNASDKLHKVSENMLTERKILDDEKINLGSELETSLKKKSQELDLKEKHLLKLQETLLARQENSDKENKRLTEVIITLEGKLQQQTLQLESAKREHQYEAEQLELKRKQLDQEKEAMIFNLKREKEKIFMDRDSHMKEIHKMRHDLSLQFQQVKKEKAKYTIHKRLQFDTGEFQEPPKIEDTEEIRELIKALEEERAKLRKAKDKLKEEEKKILDGRKKLSKQRKDVSDAVEKLYEVERGINDKFEGLAQLQQSAMNVKVQGLDALEEYKHLNGGVADFLQDIEEALLELLKQEQVVKSEMMTLNGERKKMNNTRKSLLCSSCNKPVMKKSMSSRDLRDTDDLENLLHLRSKGFEFPEDHTSRMLASFRTLGPSRTSGDGASLEALDSHVSALRKDAENDKKYLKDEVDYLRTLQKINTKTVAKYQ